MKAVARVPPSLRGCASFSPDMGFVQPGSFFDFGLRFRPDRECLARCARDGWGIVTAQTLPVKANNPETRYESQRHLKNNVTEDISTGQGEEWRVNDGGDDSGAGDKAGGMIAIPLRVDVPGQTLPARPVLQAKVTDWKVEVDCGGNGAGGGDREVVSFGSCFVGQSVSRRLSLRNTSLLPVKFGFVGNAAEVGTRILWCCSSVLCFGKNAVAFCVSARALFLLAKVLRLADVLRYCCSIVSAPHERIP